MVEDNNIHHIWESELSDKESFYIGKIVSQWGGMEHEIFIQTLRTFDNPSNEEIQLPRAMNNMGFSDVLELWNKRVIDKCEENKAIVLQKQYDEICHLKEYRNALVHGMWEWKSGELHTITTSRIRKKEIISTKFNSDELVDFYTQLARINFQIRYPVGVEELIKDKIEQGPYISRRALAMFSDSDIANDWLSPLTSSPDDSDK